MIEIKDFKEVSHPTIKARFTVYISSVQMDIREITLFESDGKRWLSMPSRQYEHEGKKKYFSYIYFSADMKKTFEDEVFKALEKYIKKPIENQKVPDNYELPF